MASLRDSDPRHVAAYRLLERLAVGGMGIVYLGESPSGRRVAVKLIRPDLAGDPEFRARFRREVEAARLVGGFHTAAVVDADPDANPPWMVTEYVPGPSLDARVRRDGPLNPAAVHQLAVALAEGLRAIHSRGLVHRDLKPLSGPPAGPGGHPPAEDTRVPVLDPAPAPAAPRDRGRRRPGLPGRLRLRCSEHRRR